MSPPAGKEAGLMEDPAPSSNEAGELLFKVAQHVAEVDRCMKRLGMMPKEEVEKFGLPANFNPFREAQGGQNRQEGNGSGSLAAAGLEKDAGLPIERSLEDENNMVASALAHQKMQFENQKAGAASLGIPPVKAQRFRARFLKTEMCRHFRSGCRNGDLCPFAHGPGELRERPVLQKTVLCNFWMQGICTLDASKCNFAHGPADLRSHEENAKTYNPPAPTSLSFGVPKQNQGQPINTAPAPPWPNQRLTGSKPGPAPQQLPMPFRMQTWQRSVTLVSAAPGSGPSQLQQADDDRQQPLSAAQGGFGNGQRGSTWHLSRDLLKEISNDELDVATFGNFSEQPYKMGKESKQMGVAAPEPTTVPAVYTWTNCRDGTASSDVGNSTTASSFTPNRGLEIVGHLSL